ncbi:MAG: OmpA family protein [Syntrophaceae bacterium]|nr:OmpA family protein [Syntrophaceae bacterium]
MAKDRLELARTAYLEAKVNRNVEAFAPLPFAEAGKALQAAEQAKKAEEMEQLAYIAEKRSKIAIAVAEARMAERDADRLSKETADIIAQKRTQEARIAQKEAENARLLALAEAERAEKARKEAEQARLAAQAESERAARAKAEAEAKTREAEVRAREVEQARAIAAAEAAKAAQAKAEADRLMKELSNLKAKQTERGIVLTIGDVLFAVGKAELSMDALRSVERLAEFLEKYPDRNVLIEGHTDSTGSDELNMTLSQQRADAVRDALTGKRIAERRITTKGYGKNYPVASNDTPTGRQQNRRVEVIILNEGVQPETQFRR